MEERDASNGIAIKLILVSLVRWPIILVVKTYEFPQLITVLAAVFQLQIIRFCC
jgi:hypothetical protein